ncbi:hypothetical protein ACQ4PT_022897 [Festuca glaucescens]
MIRTSLQWRKDALLSDEAHGVGADEGVMLLVLDPSILEAVATRSCQLPALELLHTSLRRAHHPTSALVTSGKGGVRKTTTTANLAASLARLNFPMVVLDADAGNCRLDQALIRHRSLQCLVGHLLLLLTDRPRAAPSSCACLRPPWMDLRLLLLARRDLLQPATSPAATTSQIAHPAPPSRQDCRRGARPGHAGAPRAPTGGRRPPSAKESLVLLKMKDSTCCSHP